MQTYKLRKPFDLNGKTYTELSVDFDEITANALISAYDEHNARASVKGYSNQNLPLLLVARMNGLVMEDLRDHLKGGDYLVLLRIVDDFFSDLGSPMISQGAGTGSPDTISEPPTGSSTP